MTPGDATLEMESIKQLKSRYCQFLDAKDWAAWRELLTDDFVSDVGGNLLVGADDFVAYTRATIGKTSQATVHQVHAPDITLLSPTTARGVWAVNDVVRLVPALTLHGYGHYHETYAKNDAGWRISSSRLTRLREDVTLTLLPPRVATRLRIAAAKVARRTSNTGRKGKQ
jgi:hypothetical protein